MKILKNLTFAALAATLLFQPAIVRAHDNDRGDRDRDHRDQGAAKVTLTKWVTGDFNLPGLLQTLEGVVGGDIGPGTFTGEVLKETIVGDLDEIVAFYHFSGSKHSFSAIFYLKFDLISLKAVMTGVVTEGWLKGHAVEGKMRMIAAYQGHVPAYTATIEIKRD